MNFAASMRGSHARSRSSHAGPEIHSHSPRGGSGARIRATQRQQGAGWLRNSNKLRAARIGMPLALGHGRRLLCRPLKTSILTAKL
jgi:hypothetical protein